MGIGSGDQVRQERVGDGGHAQHVDAIGREVALEGNVEERAAEDDACVVDQNVHGTGVGVEAVLQRENRGSVGDVELVGSCLGTGQCDRLGGRRQRVAVEVGHDDLGALPGETTGDGEADATGSTGDEDSLSTKISHDRLRDCGLSPV